MPIPIFDALTGKGKKPIKTMRVRRESPASQQKGLETRAKNRKSRNKKSR